jgi:hypothetical protein
MLYLHPATKKGKGFIERKAEETSREAEHNFG